MNILHLTPQYPPQKVFGLGRFVHDLARAQVEEGHAVTVVTNSLGGREHGTVKDGVQVCRVDFPPPPKPPTKETQVLQFNVGVIARALAVTGSGESWEILNAHDWYLLPAAHVLRQRLDIPVCLTMHDTVVGKTFGELSNADKFIGNVEVWGCRMADRVICCSEFMRGEILRVYGAPAERIAVVPCGVEERTFEAKRSEHLPAFREVVADPKDKIILYVGRLDPEKGVDLLLAAIPLLLRKEPRAKFLLLGTGRLEERVKEFIGSEDARGRVLYLGYVGPAPLTFLFRCADVQVAPSTYEPFGIVALEGMINRVGVVVPDETGLAEIVEHEVDGLQFKAGSAESLAWAILRLVSDDDLRRRLAAAGWDTARRRYNWARIARLTDAVYRDALQVRGAAS